MNEEKPVEAPSETATPRTDATQKECGKISMGNNEPYQVWYGYMSEHARTLERELSEALEKLKALQERNEELRAELHSRFEKGVLAGTSSVTEDGVRKEISDVILERDEAKAQLSTLEAENARIRGCSGIRTREQQEKELSTLKAENERLVKSAAIFARQLASRNQPVESELKEFIEKARSELQKWANGCEYCGGSGERSYTSDPQGGPHPCGGCKPFRELLEEIPPLPDQGEKGREVVSQDEGKSYYKPGQFEAILEEDKKLVAIIKGEASPPPVNAGQATEENELKKLKEAITEYRLALTADDSDSAAWERIKRADATLTAIVPFPPLPDQEKPTEMERRAFKSGEEFIKAFEPTVQASKEKDFARPPYPHTLHNPDGLTPEQVGEDFRLLLPEELDGRHAKVATLWAPCERTWVKAVTANERECTYRVPITVPWPAPPKEEKPKQDLTLGIGGHEVYQVPDDAPINHSTQQPDNQEAEAWRPRFKVGDRVKIIHNGVVDVITEVRPTSEMSGFYMTDRHGSKYEYQLEPYIWSLPAPPSGMQWHRTDWTEDQLPEGWRPILKGESYGMNDADEVWAYGRGPWVKMDYKGIADDLYDGVRHHIRTTRCLPDPPQLATPKEITLRIPPKTQAVRFLFDE